MKSIALLTASLGLLLSSPGHAQQAPLTGRMLSTPTPRTVATPVAPATATPAPAATPRPAPPPPASAQAATPRHTPQAPATMPSSSPATREGRVTWQPPGKIGSTTRFLVQLQSSGRLAGQALPILGDQAQRSHQRYLESFEHPIPEFFETRVREEASSGGGG